MSIKVAVLDDHEFICRAISALGRNYPEQGHHIALGVRGRGDRGVGGERSGQGAGEDNAGADGAEPGDGRGLAGDADDEDRGEEGEPVDAPPPHRVHGPGHHHERAQETFVGVV